MANKQLGTGTDQLTRSVEIECEHCNEVFPSESQSERITCAWCEQKTDRNVVQQRATIPTRYIGDKDSIEAVAELFEERAELTRELYERGWKTNSGIDGPNQIHAIPSTEGDGDTQPIDEETWKAREAEESDPTSGIGMIEYVNECLHCDNQWTVRHDEWNQGGKIVAENEVFCGWCESAVPKCEVAIEFITYPKVRFQHTTDLRPAALKLKGMADKLHDLDKAGWCLDRVNSQYLHFQYDINSTDDVVLDSRGHVKELNNT